MPELPEVETVRRMLEATVVGRTIRAVQRSKLPLRSPLPTRLGARLRGRRIDRLDRRGKYLLIELDGGLTLISHLGMSGRWLFLRQVPKERLAHVHLRIRFADGTQLWFQDPRRFGLLEAVPTTRLDRCPSLRRLGADPLLTPPTGSALRTLGQRARISMKGFLMDQRRVAGIGNIYASEILHRAGIDPRRAASTLSRDDWERVAVHISEVLAEAINSFGTTFRAYRTLWNEPGSYGDRLRVYDRAHQPCPRCGTAIRRIVQAQRSTFFCPACQTRRRSAKRSVQAKPSD